MTFARENNAADFNESLTHHINSIGGRITEREYVFLKKAYAINDERCSFSVEDFPHMSQNSFRQLIHKFRPIIEIVTKSRPCFYKIKGMYVSGDSHKITQRVNGGGHD